MAEQSIPASRRSLLAAGAAALAALAAQAVGRPFRVQAADDDPVLVGGEYTSSSVTKITNSTNSQTVLSGESTAGGTGVLGSSDSGFAVYGISTSGVGIWGLSDSHLGIIGDSSSSIGVLGRSTTAIGVVGSTAADAKPGVQGLTFTNNTGVQGFSGGSTDTPPPGRAKAGVHGYANQDGFAQGVLGESVLGTGVRGLGGIVGAWGSSDSGIGVNGTSDSSAGVWGKSESGTGVYGQSSWGAAVIGASSAGTGVVGSTAADANPGVQGVTFTNNTGVQGFSGGVTDTPPASPAKTGVYGYAAQDANSRGVTGRSTAGQGVRGQATTGTGVYATATTGTALQVIGKAQFSRSGKIAVAAGATSVTKAFPGVTTASMVFALFQTNESGVWVRAAVPADGSFTVHFNMALPTSASVAYVILN
jgi:hypothetical protein